VATFQWLKSIGVNGADTNELNTSVRLANVKSFKKIKLIIDFFFDFELNDRIIKVYLLFLFFSFFFNSLSWS
jgi:hypothetical protein